jgi:hypothetical protein
MTVSLIFFLDETKKLKALYQLQKRDQIRDLELCASKQFEMRQQFRAKLFDKTTVAAITSTSDTI